jgi:hypothetical protein
MEALFHSFLEIPVETVSRLGLVQLVLVVGVLMFKLRVPKPKKELING